MTANRRWLPAVLALVVAIGVAGAEWKPDAHPAGVPAGRTVAVQARTLVCPNVTGAPNQLATTMTIAQVAAGGQTAVSYRPLLGSRTAGRRDVAPRPAATVTVTSPYATVAVDASGPGAAKVVADQVALVPAGIGRAFSDAACVAPAADWWFAGAEGRLGASDTLFLANPSDTTANVSLSLWSASGPLSPPGATGIVVAPHTAWRRDISDLAPDASGLAVHVRADSGTVAAALYDRRYSGVTPAGGDWIPATLPPARSLVVPGYAPFAGPKGLALANPGDRDASVSLRVVTAHGAFAPAGAQSVVVPAGRSLPLDLQLAINGDPAAVLVTSDQPVVAEGVSVAAAPGRFRELAWQAAQLPLSSASAVAMTVPPFGQQSLLVLTASRGGAQVRVTSAAGATATVAVPAARSAVVDLRTVLHSGPLGPGPVVVSPLGTEPVYAVRVLYALGSHGPLLASEAPTQLPGAVSLPGVVADLRAGQPSSP